MGEGRHPSSCREGDGQWEVCRGQQNAWGVIEGDLYNKLYPGGWKIPRGTEDF